MQHDDPSEKDEVSKSPEYRAELNALDRSHFLYVSTFTSPVTGATVTHALYRQSDGSAKLHVLDSAEVDGGFVDALDRHDVAVFLRAELEAWAVAGRVN